MTALDPVQLVHDRAHVQVRSLQSRGPGDGVMHDGRVVAYYDGPCLIVEGADGIQKTWLASLPIDVLPAEATPLIAVADLSGLVDSYYWYVKRYHDEHHDQSMPWDCCSKCSTEADEIARYRKLLGREVSW